MPLSMRVSFPSPDLVCSLGGLAVRCYGGVLFRSPLESNRGQCHLLLPRPAAWPQGSGSGCRCSPLHKVFHAPPFPCFSGQGGPSPFLGEHTSRVPKEFPVWKKPARIWALGRTREITGKPCSETEQPPGGVLPRPCGWVLILLWVWHASALGCSAGALLRPG